jgi:hypothetical protein
VLNRSTLSVLCSLCIPLIFSQLSEASTTRKAQPGKVQNGSGQRSGAQNGAQQGIEDESVSPAKTPANTSLSSNSGGSKSGSVNKEWQDQETWVQFTERERSNGFRMSTPRATPKRAVTVLESAVNAQQNGINVPPTNLSYPMTAPNAANGNFSVPAYVCMPGVAPAVQPPIQRVETTLTPVIQQNSAFFPSFGFGIPGLGFGGRRYWGGNGYNGYWGGAPLFGGGPSVVGFQKQTRVVQTGPSRSSGNFYMPSTPDPSASGNYYASPTPAPVAMPIINKEPDPRDYWGKTGNPLPDDMQPH